MLHFADAYCSHRFLFPPPPQCGVVLATLLLLLAGAIVKLTCHFLLKSAILARRRNYELLGRT